MPIPEGAAEGLCARCLFLGLERDGTKGPAETESPSRFESESANRPFAPAGSGAPSRLGDYELVEEIARGGMGMVFKARQSSLGRMVAVKVVSDGRFAAPGFVRRFRLEAEAAAALDHPNIVPIFEIGEADGHPFFSMKLLEGGTLVEEARRRPFSPERAASLMAVIARAVHYAHQRGVLHRDIKPNNILLDDAGQPYLTDFGLARLVERDSTLTRTLAVLGTPAYMSPEQARGEARSLTTAADVYGLGAVLFELLTGQPPFAGGTSVETVRLVLDQEARRPSSLNPRVDRDLDTICLACLAKDPARRYGSAEAVADDLERWRRHEPIRARPSSPRERLMKWVRRRPAVAALVGTAVLAVLVLSTVWTVFTWRLRAAQRIIAAESEANREKTIQLLVAQATRATEDGDYYEALLPLVECIRREAGRGPLEDVQRLRLGALLRQCPRLGQLWVHDGAVLHVAASADGRWWSTASSDGVAQVREMATGERVGPALVHTSGVMQAVFSPDARRLVTQEASGYARTWDFRTGRPVGSALPQRSSPYQPIVFRPDGSRVAIAGPDFPRVYALDDGPGPRFELKAAGAVQGLGASRDGRLLVSGGMDGVARLWDFDRGDAYGTELKHPAPVRAAVFAAADRLVVTVAQDWRVRVWDAESGNLNRVAPPHRADVLGWALHPNGLLFATGGSDNVARVWDLTNTGPALVEFRHAAGVDSVAFGPEGERLATGSYDGTARLWSLATGEGLPPRFPHAAGVSVVRFDETGERLVTATFRGDVRQWGLVRDDGARAILRPQAAPVLAAVDGGGTNGSAAVVVVAEDGSIRRWSAYGHGGVDWLADHGSPASAAAMDPGSNRVVVGGTNGQVTLWGVGEAAPRRRWTAHSDRVVWMGFDRTGRRILTTSTDGTAAVWGTDRDPGAPIVARMHHGDDVLRADLAPGDGWIATGGMGGIFRLWDAASGAARHAPTQHVFAVSAVEFSPDGRRALTANWDYSNQARGARLWDPATGREIVPPMMHRDGVVCARFSSDGRLIATGGEDNLARVWFADSGRPATPFVAHQDFVVDVAFDAEARLFATASRDGTARVWEVANGRPVTPPLRHQGRVRRVVFAPDGRSLITTADDRTVRVWDLGPVEWPVEDLAALAELLASHRLEPGGDRTPLTTAEMKERWDGVRAQHPEYWMER